jgi:hypothetical protein
MKITIAMLFRTLVRVVFVSVIIFLLLALLPAFWPALSGGSRSRHIDQQKHFAALFKAGDTNAPLLAMDWFYEHGNYFCRVSQSGNVNSARDVGHAIQGGSGISSRFALDSTNRPLLVAAISALPASSKKSLPKERQIWVSGIRSNQWFQFVYDRANIPVEVENLYDMTGAYLEWFIPIVGWSPNGVEHGMSQNDPGSFSVAKDAPIATSYDKSSLQIWNLNKHSIIKFPSLGKMASSWRRTMFDSYGIQAVAPDGTIAGLATDGLLLAVDLQNQKILWHTDQVDSGNIYEADNRTLAIGNHGQSLFVAEKNSIGKWRLADGTKLATLTENSPRVKLLQSSRDGSLLIAGFADNSFTVWNTATDQPVFHFTVSNEMTCFAISPDNKKIALTGFGQRKIVVYDLRNNSQEEFPLRTPYASISAYSLCWSPDGKKVAAYIDTYPSCVIIYDAVSWKPIARWQCGAIGTRSLFAFDFKGILFEYMDGTLISLDVNSIKELPQ